MSEVVYERARRRVGQRLAWRVSFWVHLITFTFVTSSLMYSPYSSAPVMTMFNVAWFVLLMMHGGVWLYRELFERALRRELERERRWMLLEELHSMEPELRERAVRLADVDEGELVRLESALQQTAAKRKRREDGYS